MKLQVSPFLITATSSLTYHIPVFSAHSRNFSLLLFGCKTSFFHSPSSTSYLFWQLPLTSPDVQSSGGVQSLHPFPPNTSNIRPSPASPSRPTSITVPIRNGWDQPQRWQIEPADISEVEVTDMQRFSLDKPLLLWLWPSPQSSLVLSAWKSYASVFPMQKVSETEPQTSLHFSTLEGKPFFTPSEYVPVNIQNWSLSTLSLSVSFWLWHQNWYIWTAYILY